MTSLLRLGAMALLLSLLAACHQEPKTGPVEVKWDRDTCVRCNMALSDKRYAAQVRGGPKHQAFKFDDFGCVVFWLKDKPWADDPATEIWVMDMRSGKWIEARKAYYVPNKMTPMAYGFGAVALPEPGSVNYVEARKQVLAKGK
ncbi:MAG: nitrous oxide reductase accessory protein NosL [Gammaproteobacteria bacterium]|nr:nitrous oxide reductase accessory protein NosL [Gammaproteobacteria bacterium]MBU1731258.1 nitrous oxide reductase accessory protein NosL [Gammaproteobacteria bacterium]MBU1892763.1 nitrous oxide reductase accessory protein NosL [Gammaproteobacteria bacterium]